MVVRVSLKGAKAFRNNIEQIPEDFDKEVRLLIKGTTKRFRDNARKLSPKETGELRKSIQRDVKVQELGGLKTGEKRYTGHAFMEPLSKDGFVYNEYHEIDFPGNKYKKPTTRKTEPHAFQKTYEVEQNVFLAEAKQVLDRVLGKAGR